MLGVRPRSFEPSCNTKSNTISLVVMQGLRQLDFTPTPDIKIILIILFIILIITFLILIIILNLHDPSSYSFLSFEIKFIVFLR
jgi:hypothetical protein